MFAPEITLAFDERLLANTNNHTLCLRRSLFFDIDAIKQRQHLLGSCIENEFSGVHRKR
jgi:hypothetical protein